MKNNLLYTLIIAGFVAFGCKSGNTGANDTTAMNDTTSADSLTQEDSTMGGMMNAAHTTMEMLDSMKLTGDPDYDFATMMTLHHKGGIAMNVDQIKNGSDSTTKALAKQIKESQEKDLEDLQKFTASNTPKQTNQEFLDDVKSKMEQAKDNMDKNMRRTGNFDKDFVALMTMHHKHGLDMAKAEVKHGKNPELKKLAQEMIDKQEKERKQLADIK